MAQIEIISEAEDASGWRFDAQAIDEAGTLHRFALHLSWADYNHWSADGSDAPASVAEAALLFLLSRCKPDEMRPSFDASIVRRLHADADEQIPRMIKRPDV